MGGAYTMGVVGGGVWAGGKSIVTVSYEIGKIRYKILPIHIMYIILIRNSG